MASPYSNRLKGLSVNKIALALLVALFYTHAIADAPGTMRVDYVHSGNHETEMFSLDQVVIEPLPWTGNMAQPYDKTNRGKYLFEIVDPESGDVAWSRSFSSIYGEWETTGEARQINRAYHESVRFPAQQDVFELVMKKRGAGNVFEEVWRIRLDPDDVLRTEGAGAIRRLLEDALPMVQLLWRRETEGKSFDSPERKAALDRALREAIKQVRDPSLRRHYGDEINRLRRQLFDSARPVRQTGGGGTRFGRSFGKGPAIPMAETKMSALAAAGSAFEDQLREAVILAAARGPDFGIEKLKAAIGKAQDVH